MATHVLSVRACLSASTSLFNFSGEFLVSSPVQRTLPPCFRMQNILDQNLDMATALLAGEKLKELILPGSSQDERGGLLAGLMVQLKLELPFDRVVTIGTVIIPILLVTLVFTRNFAGETSAAIGGRGVHCHG